MAACSVTVLVFSGRPDPRWALSEGVVDTLEGIWTALEPAPDAGKAPPPLGYKGCRVTCADGAEWFIYRTRVTRRHGARSEARLDRERQSETLILASAPQGLIPPGVLDDPRPPR